MLTVDRSNWFDCCFSTNGILKVDGMFKYIEYLYVCFLSYYQLIAYYAMRKQWFTSTLTATIQQGQ